MIKRFYTFFKEYLKENNKLSSESGDINVKRIAYGAAIAMLVNIVCIAIFSSSETAYGQADKLWRSCIIASHSIMLVLMAAFFITAMVLRKREKQGVSAKILQYSTFCTLLAAGVSLVSFDQLVTTNITPYILVCVIAGAVFMIRPLYSGLIYLASYAVFFYCIALAPNTSETIISNRSNGFAAIAIGFVISVMMWRNKLLNERQARCINQQKKKLEKLAYSDPLTGLPNRGHFDEMIKNEIALAKCSLRESCLIMLDIDFFKSVNDSYGHPSGDMLLVQVGELLSKNIRRNDFICRLGGEEFILLLPDISLDDAKEVAEKLRRLIEQNEFRVQENTVRITASLGVSVLDHSLDSTLAHQYSRVDRALYQAKKRGRNRVVTV